MLPLILFVVLVYFKPKVVESHQSCVPGKYFEPESLHGSLTAREHWSDSLKITNTTLIYGGDTGPTYCRKSNTMILPLAAFGPITPKCINLERFDEGINQKFACGLLEFSKHFQNNCHIVSIGSNN